VPAPLGGALPPEEPPDFPVSTAGALPMPLAPPLPADGGDTLLYIGVCPAGQEVSAD
jgi:hypothetical protein